MKKVILSQVLVMFFVFNMTAQLKVSSEGNVGIKVLDAPLSTLGINTLGSANTEVSIDAIGKSIGLSIKRSASSLGSTSHFGISSICNVVSGSDISVGVYGVVTGSSSSNKAIGMYGFGDNSYGCSYGVLGMGSRFRNNDSNSGAGVFGTAAFTAIPTITGRYAGYFLGDVKVTGTINGITVGNSDIRYKQDIVELETKKSKILNNILSLNPVEYKLKQQHYEATSEKGEKSSEPLR